MFLVTNLDMSNKIYSILDTEDGVTEQLSCDTVLSYLNQGVRIIGVTKETLDLNIRATIILKFYEGRDILYYSKSCLYNKDYFNMYTDDLVDPLELKMSLDDFKFLLNYTKHITTLSIEDCSPTYVYMGKIDNFTIRVLDKISNESYEFDIFNIMDSISSEKRVIIGVDYIDNCSVRLKDGTILTKDDYLINLFNSGDTYYEKRVKFNIEDRFDFSSRYYNLSDLGFIQNKGFVVSDFLNIPIYNVNDFIEDTSENLYNSIYPLRIKSITKKIELEDDSICDISDVVSYACITNPTLKDKILGFINTSIAKLSLVGGDSASLKKMEGIKKEFEFCIENTSIADNCIISFSKFYTNVSNCLISTNFGNIRYIRNKKRYYNHIFLKRVTHTGETVFSLDESAVLYGRPSDFNKYGVRTLYNNYDCNYHELDLTIAEESDLLVHNEYMLPLRFNKLGVVDDGVIITVWFLVKPENGDPYRWSNFDYSVVEIPLLFTCLPVYTNNNVVRIRTVYEDLILDKNVYDNLCGKIDEEMLGTSRRRKELDLIARVSGSTKYNLLASLNSFV